MPTEEKINFIGEKIGGMSSDELVEINNKFGLVDMHEVIFESLFSNDSETIDSVLEYLQQNY